MEIGNHTWEHPNMTAIRRRMSPRSSARQVTPSSRRPDQRRNCPHRRGTGQRSGARRGEEAGCGDINWDVIPFDWIIDANIAATRYMLMTQIKPGSVVLFPRHLLQHSRFGVSVHPVEGQRLPPGHRQPTAGTARTGQQLRLSRDNGPPANVLSRHHGGRHTAAAQHTLGAADARTIRSPITPAQLRRTQQRSLIAVSTDTRVRAHGVGVVLFGGFGSGQEVVPAPALIFVVFGIGLGPFVLDVIEGGPDASSFIVIAQLAFDVILFNQGGRAGPQRGRPPGRHHLPVVDRRIRWRSVRHADRAVLLPVMPVRESVVPRRDRRSDRGRAPFDALLDDERIPVRVRHALLSPKAASMTALRWQRCWRRWRWHQSGRIAIPRAGRCSWCAPRGLSLVVGLATGAVGGWVIARSRRRGWMSDTLGSAGHARAGSGVLRGGGTFARQRLRRGVHRRLAFAVRGRERGRASDMQVPDAAGQLLELMVFAMFGGYAVIVGLARRRVASDRLRDRRAGRGAADRCAGRVVRQRDADAQPALHRLVRSRGFGNPGARPADGQRGEIEQEPLITQVRRGHGDVGLVVQQRHTYLGIRWLEARRRSAKPF